MAKKPAQPEEIPTFFSPADIAAESERGQTIRDNPMSMLPALPQWGEPDVQTRDRVMAALQGFGKSQEAAVRVAGLGDPVAAALASIAGAAGAPDPQAIAAQRQDMQRQALLARFEAAPVEAVSPDLVKAHPELKGIPLKYVHQIAPILERDAAHRDQHYNLDQAATLMAPNGKAEEVAAAKATLTRLYPNGQVPKDLVHLASQNARQQVTVGEKDSQYLQRRLTALGDALDASKAKAGALAESQKVVNRGERLQSLAASLPNLRASEIEELAIGLNSMLSGSNVGAASQVAALVPKSAVGDARKLQEWLTNNPTGTDQQAFVKRMMGSVEREKATAAAQIQREQFKRVGRYADLEKSNPDEFYNVLQSAGVDPAAYQAWKAGGYKPMSAVQAPEGGGGAVPTAPAPIGGNQAALAIKLLYKQGVLTKEEAAAKLAQLK